MFYSPAILSQMRQRPVGPSMNPMMMTGSAMRSGYGQGGPPGYGQPGVPAGAGPAPGHGILGDMAERLRQSAAEKQSRDNPQLPFFPEDRGLTSGLLGDRNPYAGAEWGGLIKQLQDQAAGNGPSVAEQAYSRAQGDTTAALASMAQGSASPAAARQAQIQRQRVGQGMASGLAEARTGEMLAGQNALSQALAQRDTLNQNAYLDVLGKQLGMSRDQLQGLIENNRIRQQRDAANAQANAAKWNAVAGGIGTAATLL